MLQRLAADLLPHVPSLTSGEVARGAKSFALLKWLSPPLFEALAQVSQADPARPTGEAWPPRTLPGYEQGLPTRLTRRGAASVGSGEWWVRTVSSVVSLGSGGVSICLQVAIAGRSVDREARNLLRALNFIP